MISENKKAPPFSLPDQDGTTVTLKDLKGQWVVLYFYPKDNTSGCTQEACDFRDNLARLKKRGAVVLGVSPDSQKSHAGFALKQRLNFPLLVDADHAVAEAYGAWGEKSMYGKKYFGILRTTVLVRPDGTVARLWTKVKVAGHVDDVLGALADAQKSAA